MCAGKAYTYVGKEGEVLWGKERLILVYGKLGFLKNGKKEYTGEEKI